MMQLNNDYQRDDFIKFLEEDFLTDFKRDVRPVNTSSLTCINKAQYLGESKDLDLQVFEFLFEGSANKRVALTKDAFSVMRSSAIYNALAVFHTDDNKDWRFSLLTATPEPTEKGKVSLTYSNPKRLSFFLGPNAKVNTPTRFLISKGKIVDFEDLKSRFSIEVVNKEFYKEISQAFTELVSGQLKLPSTQDKSQTNLEFAVRLIGRIIFCWFLREKKSDAGLSLMPKELLSIEAVQKNRDYYHSILEPIFFEVLNKQVKSRRDDFVKEPFSSVPYLNGGLFSPQEDDFYKRLNGDLQSQFHNTLVIPDSWLNSFFEILETYNFTIDENTSYDEELSIDPEMLGRIFENLLAEINPETGESARKSTGSYYTPRTIVNYMVDESLLLYLKEQTGIKEEKLRAIVSYDLSDDSENPINTEEKEKIIEALENVKILDPACGSGAFPIGALQKIVFILQQTDPEGVLWKKQQLSKADIEFKRDIETRFSKNQIDFLRKSAIIRKSIFGIDIQPIATEISRLRCFLTLIVDEVVDEQAENRGIKPLPNLDFKFVTANSLISLPQDNQSTLFEDKYGIDQLKDLRDRYFGATNEERYDLKDQFKEVQKKMLSRMIDMKTDDDLTRKLSEWNPFSHQVCNWFDSEWMFGIKDGFDIVLANPPYVSFHGVNKDIKVIYKKIFESARGKYDIYLLFIERSLQLIKNGRFLCFIIPNKFIKSNYGKSIKNIITKNKIIEILDFNDVQVFSAVTNYTCVISIQKSEIVPNYEFMYKSVNSFESSEISTRNHIIKQFELSGDLWILGNNSETKLLELIKGKRKTLDDISITITQGIRTGQLEVFYTNITPDFIQANKIEDDLIIPILHGKNVKRFGVRSTTTDILLFPYEHDHKTPVNLGDYPFAKKYLEKYKSELLKRKDSGKTFSQTNKNWYEYWDTKPLCFTYPKIVFPDISDKNQFCLDTKGLGYLNTCYGIFLKDVSLYKSILGILNSKLIEFFIKKISPFVRGGFYRYKTSYIKQIPIPELTSSNIKELEVLVENIIDLTSSHGKEDDIKKYEKQIDQLVFKLYGLTTEDVEVIEKYYVPTNKNDK